MGNWFKNYAVGAVLLVSALVGGTIWMVEKEVQAQTARLEADIAGVQRGLERSFASAVAKLTARQEAIEAQQKADSAALKTILDWVKEQQRTAKGKPEGDSNR